MKILKQGVIPPNPDEAWAELTCSHCQTEFEIQWKERMVTYGRPCEDNGYHYPCPLCKTLIDLAYRTFRHRAPVVKPERPSMKTVEDYYSK